MKANGLIPARAADGAVAIPIVASATGNVRWMSSAQLLADAALSAAWDDLARETAEPNPFAERWYLSAALKALDRAQKVRIALVWDGGLIGIMPLQGETRYAGLPLAHSQNWLNYNAFLGSPLVRKGYEPAFWRIVLTELDNRNDYGLFLHLTGMPCKGVVTDALLDVCRNDGRHHALVQHEARALLQQGLSPDAYFETHVRGKKRKELRRQHKRLAEEGALTFTRSEDGAGLDPWIDEFLALEIRGWKGSERSALACTAETEALFRNALHGAAKACKLERLDLRLDGKPVAMLANFLTPPGAFSFKTAFDENYARFSPGVLLQIENLALLDRQDIQWCDSCAAQDHPMIDSLWAGRRDIGRYSIAIGGAAKRAAFALLLSAEKAKARLKGRTIT